MHSRSLLPPACCIQAMHPAEHHAAPPHNHITHSNVQAQGDHAPRHVLQPSATCRPPTTPPQARSHSSTAERTAAAAASIILIIPIILHSLCSRLILAVAAAGVSRRALLAAAGLAAASAATAAAPFHLLALGARQQRLKLISLITWQLVVAQLALLLAHPVVQVALRVLGRSAARPVATLGHKLGQISEATLPCVRAGGLAAAATAAAAAGCSDAAALAGGAAGGRVGRLWGALGGGDGLAIPGGCSRAVS